MESNHTQFPSFFKVLIGDFAEKLQIPPDFESEFDVNIPKNVTILAKKEASKWAVKIKQIGESLCFTSAGWQTLVADNDLKFGDFLIFRLISSTVFDITTYGPNGCEKVAVDIKLSNAETCGHDSHDLDISDEAFNRQIEGGKEPSLETGKPNTGASKSCKPIGPPRTVAGKFALERKKNLSFVLVLKKYHKSYVTIPRAFANGSEIDDKDFVVLKTRQGKSYPVNLQKRPLKGNYGRINTGDGWRKFWDDNNLTINDRCVFKFVTGSRNIIHVEISPAT